jgi:RNA recognition motif-containing protein
MRHSWCAPIRSGSPTLGAAEAARAHDRARSRKPDELSKKLYVGNLPFSATESDLRSLFERHGRIASVNVITDRETGRARGFAFVEMEEASDCANAIRALDGADLGGRSLRVSEAQDKRSGGGFGRNR